ncbi:MAG: hypothetical protein RSE00_00860 [Clostridia bacterium]
MRVIKKFLKVLLIIVAIVAVLAIIAIVGIKVAVSNTANSNEYKVGADKIPSLKTVVGKKDVISTGISTENGVITKTIEYKKSDVSDEEMVEYIEYLISNEKFKISKKSRNLVELCKKSVDDGEIVFVMFENGSTSHLITVKKCVGTLRDI